MIKTEEKEQQNEMQKRVTKYLKCEGRLKHEWKLMKPIRIKDG